jgi:hypothetical protein
MKHARASKKLSHRLQFLQRPPRQLVKNYFEKSLTFARSRGRPRKVIQECKILLAPVKWPSAV